MPPSVIITEDGRSGNVIYSEGLRSITGYWEFGGGDVVTIVSMGTREEWEGAQAWAMERRAAILRFVADEVVRQRAPSCVAEIEEERGVVQVKRGGGAGARGEAAAFVRRYSNIKAMVGIGALVAALAWGAVMWLGKKTLTVAPASGVPLGECVRTDAHIASLIQTTDPHLPEISGRGGNTTTSISILLIPLDDSAPFVVPVVQEIEGNGYSLSRILGSDGRTLWFDCTGLFGVRLSDHELVTTEDLRKANPVVDPTWWEDQRHMDVIDGKLVVNNADRSAALVVDPETWKATPTVPKVRNDRFGRNEPGRSLAAGFITSTGSWCGLHAQEELDRSFKVKEWIRPVESAEDAKRMRRLCAADLEPSDDGMHFRIQRIAPVTANEYLNAAFLRMSDDTVPLLLRDPESALMVHTDKPGLGGMLMVSRIDTKGNVLWTAGTGIDRFDLAQILPGINAFAFVGTRPPIPNKLSEPLVVLVDNATGQVTTHSLWR